MGKVVGLTDAQTRRNNLWQEGYSDGYNRRTEDTSKPEVYKFGYISGEQDRAEDEAALETGDFDLLTPDERHEIYGDEKDRV